MEQQPADVARRIVDANSYLTLATVDAGGRPWATPVWYAAVDCNEFFWVSRPDARHSENISATRAVGIVIFDSTVPAGAGEAVYVEALAEEVDDSQRAAALAVYSGRSQARGIRAWQESDVVVPAPHRLYRARASQVYVLDDGDRRVPVT